MGVEVLGSIGSVMGSVAEGLAGAASVSGPKLSAPAFEAAPSVDFLGGIRGSALDIGSVLGPVKLPGNERPAGFGGFETMPLRFDINPVKEIRFNEPLSAPSVIAEAEAILAQARKPLLTKMLDVRTLFSPAVEPAIKVESSLSYQVATQPKTESRVAYQAVPAVAVQPAWGELVKEVREKKIVVTENNQQARAKIESSQESTERKIKFVEAVEVSKARKDEIRAAVKRLGKGILGIFGRLVAKLLSVRFWEYKSPIVRDGRDCTLDLTADAIAGDLTEYGSREEAEEVLAGKVEQNIPIAVGEGGKPATVEEVRKVFRGEDLEMGLPRPKTAAEIVVKRIIRKRTEVLEGKEPVEVVEEKVEKTGETDLENLGLVAVFPGLT